MPSQPKDETGLIDVGEWQAVFDLRTGEPLDEGAMGDETLPKLLGRLPFPGDLSPRSASWVTDVALEINRLYSPSLIILIHASLSFKTMYGEGDVFDVELEGVYEEIGRFISTSGLDFLILGLGNLAPVEGFVDLSGLDGLGLGGGFPSSYAGVYRPSVGDMAFLEGLGEVIRVVGRDELRAQFGGYDDFYERIPDYFLELAESHTVKGFGIPARRPSHMPSKDGFLPLSAGMEPPPALKSITDLKGYLERSTREGRRMALILIEGLGESGFPWRYQAVDNTMGWFRYPLGDAQYLALSSGKHMTEHGHPPCLRYYLADDLYPYSGIFNEPLPGLIGRDAVGLTVAVGNRSIYTHACLGADISIECFARTLYNFGTLAVLRRVDAT
ncbi:MAG: hypothetical protein SWK76_15420 [Actinomycetota bacterium]|nr:hypothetical protein [Actinomycetota bacterium]